MSLDVATDRYYSHSGRFSPAAVAAALGAGAVAGIGMGLLYAYAIAYIPVIGVVTFILTAGFAAVVGAVTGQVMRSGKVRNNTVAALTGLPVGLVALWAAWVGWISALIGRADGDVSLLNLALDPGTLWRVIELVNDKGAWSFKGSTPTGGILWAMWGAEALIIVAGVAFVAYAMVSDPFCEECELWCAEQKGYAVLGVADPADFKARIEGGDFAALKALPPATDTAFTRLDLHQCPQCKATSTLTAKGVTVTTKGNKTETNEADVFTWLRLPPSQLASLRTVLDERTRAQADALARAQVAAP